MNPEEIAQVGSTPTCLVDNRNEINSQFLCSSIIYGHVQNHQLSSCDSGLQHCNSWAMSQQQGSHENDTHYITAKYQNHLDIDPTSYNEYDSDEDDDYPYFHTKEPKLVTSYSTPTRPSSAMSGRSASPETGGQRHTFLLELGQIRDQLVRFRNEMDGLAKQMDGMAVDLRDSKNRVSEIEEDLTATQEDNVNLQVLLERAVTRQKESDVFATRAVRHMHADLASVVKENNQLQSRLAMIANYQRAHQGNLSEVVRKMHEYAEMLGQAQGTIQMLQEPRTSLKAPDDLILSLAVRRASTTGNSLSGRKETRQTPIVSPETAELYRHRIIRKRTSLPGVSPTMQPKQPQTNLPQQGLRLLLNDYGRAPLKKLG
ncbi:hypothetical protein EC973_009685 [Apophysomyces ossiformis]|uniref:Uncharacterized protein n=1 Tax=Apophysomyces ossiformis TaxID=679940 RepID=A0A8H7BLJ8_9FUNG|nr:hypothetical protein EC973_009685 [Apophysomyces ossiformis]